MGAGPAAALGAAAVLSPALPCCLPCMHVMEERKRDRGLSEPHVVAGLLLQVWLLLSKLLSAFIHLHHVSLYLFN